MNEILEMARQAHRKLVTEVYVGHTKQLDPWTIDLLIIFSQLVADKAIKDAPDYKMGYADGVAVEREACAKVCESAEEYPQYFQNTSLAAAIRNRGQA